MRIAGLKSTPPIPHQNGGEPRISASATGAAESTNDSTTPVARSAGFPWSRSAVNGVTIIRVRSGTGLPPDQGESLCNDRAGRWRAH